MKTKWLISVRQGSLEKVVDALRMMQVSVMEVLDIIGVVIIEPNGFDIADIRKIEDVENVEEEKDVSI